MDELRSQQSIGHVRSALTCQVPGCHAEADFSEPTLRDGDGSATMLYLCSEHYMTHLNDRAYSQHGGRSDGTPNETNGQTQNAQDPDR